MGCCLSCPTPFTGRILNFDKRLQVAGSVTLDGGSHVDQVNREMSIQSAVFRRQLTALDKHGLCHSSFCRRHQDKKSRRRRAQSTGKQWLVMNVTCRSFLDEAKVSTEAPTVANRIILEMFGKCFTRQVQVVSRARPGVS